MTGARNLKSHEVRGKIRKNDVGRRMLTFTVRRSLAAFLPIQLVGLRGRDQRPVSLEDICEPFIPLRSRRLLAA
jgi:hypothetical protein